LYYENSALSTNFFKGSCSETPGQQVKEGAATRPLYGHDPCGPALPYYSVEFCAGKPLTVFSGKIALIKQGKFF
jgi:hypothetical protein